MKGLFKIFFALALISTACSQTEKNKPTEESEIKMEISGVSGNEEIATLAGGCFWCIEAPFEKIEGVIKVISGYAGGTKSDPTYKEVSSGKTDYREAVQVYFDPDVISYSEIIDIYWKQFDPTDKGGERLSEEVMFAEILFFFCRITITMIALRSVMKTIKII